MHVREIAWRDPARALLGWSGEPWVAFLDSAASADPRGRYSYLCVEPFRVIETTDGDPFELLRRELSAWRLEPGEAPAPFAGGAVGFLGYELGRHLERLPSRHPNDLDIPDLAVGLYDVVIAFDAVLGRCWICSSGFPEAGQDDRERRAVRRADEVLRRLERSVDPPPLADPVAWRAELSWPQYRERIAKILEYIRDGDIFQANFTMRFLARRPVGFSPAAAHLLLRRKSPAPFAAFLGCGERLAISSASPERFLSLEASGRIETRPIKGTRPRHVHPGTDAWLRGALAASLKDRAENLMITDLMRNDIGRVAAIGSVVVPARGRIESFASVHHLVSTVQAVLRPGLGAVDLLRATFPGGSITGAPKIRAMQIIDELEESRRGPYCGSIAWIGFDGAMDSSIVIRTLVMTPETIVAQAGGGIVADSTPEEEYEELLVKVRPLLLALGDAPA